MSQTGEISLEKRTKVFSTFCIDGVSLIPRKYVRVGTGFNLDYETPTLLSCLPLSRHLQHQQVLIKYMQKIYPDNIMPQEAKSAYIDQWTILRTRHDQKSHLPYLMRYGLTFQNRGKWGDSEPLPLIRFIFP